MANILDFPDELLLLAFSPLPRSTLRALIQTCSRLRRLCILLYLRLLGITPADIDSGTLRLRESSTFIALLLMAWMRPGAIKRVVVFNEQSAGNDPDRKQHEMQLLTRILAILPAPILDMKLYTPRKAPLLSLLFDLQPAQNPHLVVVSKSPSISILSRPRKLRSIVWTPHGRHPEWSWVSRAMFNERLKPRISGWERARLGLELTLTGPFFFLAYAIAWSLWTPATMLSVGKQMVNIAFAREASRWTPRERVEFDLKHALPVDSPVTGVKWMRVQVLRDDLVLLTLADHMATGSGLSV
ncbi:F-box domain-containing protein [Mycena chlorophos]|uniref:F-box domain-containing protein n=1 Tax=Mycena chlorophos TaxID=658473 RepID=A0A8H6THA6_MYCCL|nr:F-box domain-containing protein [Mycena chlorophos]